MMLGRHESAEVKTGMQFLRDKTDEQINGGDRWAYAAYYGTIAMNLSGPDDMRAWYPKIRDHYLAIQKPDGSFGGRDARPGFDTAIALICLGMPYGYVPAYQR
jgi:hypothetical protein